MIKTLTYIFFFFSISLVAQVGIGTETPHPSSILDITSSSQGMLPPKIALTDVSDITTITNPVEGLVIYNTTDNGCDIKKGLYVFDGTRWRNFNNKQTPAATRLIRDVIGITNVAYTILNATEDFANHTFLFNDIDDTAGATYHATRTTTTADWGFALGLNGLYTITSIDLDGRNDCCTTRLNNVRIQLYKCGVEVYQSAKINTAVAGLNNFTIPGGGMLADEIRVVVLNGGNTDGNTPAYINFTEMLVRGFN